MCKREESGNDVNECRRNDEEILSLWKSSKVQLRHLNNESFKITYINISNQKYCKE
ncbi:unnamed protein product [Brugia timori]|uniref:Phlebovirus glycoprotein G2 fusion domain-containing protein n=1 Tax=Brugia timori TaxID=42155 RepID=A0A0R3QWK2_9BILA|nr:unnamed protein product [Brugia timori]